MNNIENQLLTFTVALSNDAHDLAQQCANGITSPAKAKQVYVNTLAIYAVDFYLRCMGFNTDWLHSASRNPLLIKLMNIGDLAINDIGKIECIPVASDRVECDITPESENERVGYVPVRINENQTEATILGFSTQKSGTIKLDRLADLEYAIEYLTNLEQPAIIKLREWLNGLVDSGWETLDRVLNPAQQRLFYRGTVNRGHKIDLVSDTGIISSTLVVDIKSTESSQEIDILIQVYPTEQNELPAGIKLTVSDDKGTMMSAISKSGDNWIQLSFTAVFDEEFTVTLGLGESEVMKKFTV